MNVHMLADLLHTSPWPNGPAADSLPHLPPNGVPYHVRLIIEVGEDDHVRLRVFAPTFPEARGEFVGGSLIEGVNTLQLRFPDGRAALPANDFLAVLGAAYRSAVVGGRRCVSEEAAQEAKTLGWSDREL